MAAPDPTGTPGLPLPAVAGPANSAPVPSSVMTVPFPGVGWLIPKPA